MNPTRPADIPEDWELLPPGDAALTRRVKAAGPHRVITEKKGRRTFSRGVWAPSATINDIRNNLQQERSTPAWQKRQENAAKRRDAKQAEYVDDFLGAVLAYLDFHPDYSEFAQRLALAVTQHATPVGSGTVARTQRIPLQRRAQAAVIAWMRHQTTGYDEMVIPRQRGKRREVRERLARRSRELLSRYRKGLPIEESCPLQTALSKLPGLEDGF